jgi:tetratricopeptide (TPR) repeat protein
MKSIVVCLGVSLLLNFAKPQSANAIRLFEERQFDKAKEAFENLARQEPRNAIAHYYLGKLLLMEQFLDADRAVEMLEKSTALDPTNAEFYYLLGLGISKQTQGAGFVRQLFLIPKVKDAMVRAINLDTNYIEAHQMLGRYYQEIPSIYGGDEQKAWRELEIVTSLDSVRGKIFKAWLLEKREKFDAAEGMLKDLLRTHEHDWRSWNAFGAFLQRRKSWKEALPRIQTYAELRPDTADSHTRLGENMLRLGDTENAIRQFQASLTIDPYANSTLLLLAEAFEQIGGRGKALEIYKQLAPRKLRQDQKKIVERKIKELS